MIESLPEDHELHIYSCNKLNHRWHIVLVNSATDTVITNIKSMTLDYGLGLMEEYLKGAAFENKKKKG